WTNNRALELSGPGNNDDSWDAAYGGVRLDKIDANGRSLTVDGGLDRAGPFGERRDIPVRASVPTFETVLNEGHSHDGHLLMRLRQEEDYAGWQLQSYYDRMN